MRSRTTPDGTPLVDHILDTAAMPEKARAKWTVKVNSQDLGITPSPFIAEAVYSRCVSALKDERVKAARKLEGPAPGAHQHCRQCRKEEAVYRRHSGCAVLFQNRELRAGLHTAIRAPPPRNMGGTSTTAASRSCGAAAASSRSRFPRQDQGSLRQQSQAHEPVAG